LSKRKKKPKKTRVYWDEQAYEVLTVVCSARGVSIPHFVKEATFKELYVVTKTAEKQMEEYLEQQKNKGGEDNPEGCVESSEGTDSEVQEVGQKR